jgi:hypothetical protein
MKNKEQIYMQYICANSECDCIFLDKDVKGRMTPVKGFYCSDCQSKGFKNPKVRLKKCFTKEQIINRKKYQFKARKNVLKKDKL